MESGPVYSQKKIQIYVNDRRLYLIIGSETAKIFQIAVGKPQTPTPSGTYHIINKIVNPGGVLGTRWMGLDIPNGPYGIHGTFKPDSIGKAISNGCIRLHNHDVEQLFTQIRVGTTVVIEYSQTGSPGLPNGSYGKTHMVQPGDTLWKISRKYGVPLDVLIKLNNIENPDNLVVGMELKIP